MKHLIFILFFLLYIGENRIEPITNKPESNFSVVSISFDEAFKQIQEFEGGYANNPYDAGGETYCGISRRVNPNWTGWFIIDRHPLRYNQVLIDLTYDVKLFFEQRYWLQYGFEKIENQRLANKMFNIAVHLGGDNAKKLLSRVLECPFDSCLTIIHDNRQNKAFMDLILLQLNNLQIQRYIDICSHYPEKRIFLKVWLKRCYI
jgi:hypothetical protein